MSDYIEELSHFPSETHQTFDVIDESFHFIMEKNHTLFHPFQRKLSVENRICNLFVELFNDEVQKEDQDPFDQYYDIAYESKTVEHYEQIVINAIFRLAWFKASQDNEFPNEIAENQLDDNYNERKDSYLEDILIRIIKSDKKLAQNLHSFLEIQIRELTKLKEILENGLP